MNLSNRGCEQRQQTDYNEYERRLTKQFIHGLDDKGICEFLREVPSL